MNEKQVKAVYAAYSLDDPERLASSSGGVFSLLARAILSGGGVVYGVAMSADCKRAEFIRAADEVGLARIRTSKYLQAHVGAAFRCVKEDLDNGFHVLFTGTGCQINGLIGFLGAGKGADLVSEKYPKLYCADVVCHGAPSPALWREYAAYMEKNNNARLTGINFRCKDIGGADFGMKMVGSEHKKIYVSKNEDPYMRMFLRDYCLRPSCYECKAKGAALSDITLADFWGIEEAAPEMSDGKGTSLVLVRTDKGKELLARVAEKLKMKEVSYEVGVACNPSEYRAVKRPPQRDLFFDDMKTLSFEELKAKYGMPPDVSLKRKIKSKIKNILLKAKIMRVDASTRVMDYCLCFDLAAQTSDQTDGPKAQSRNILN